MPLNGTTFRHTVQVELFRTILHNDDLLILFHSRRQPLTKFGHPSEALNTNQKVTAVLKTKWPITQSVFLEM